jgi:peptide/nickel transport system permease protein
MIKLLKGILKHQTGRIGLIMVAFVIVIAIFAHYISPYDPYDLFSRDLPRLAPSAGHLLGTDHIGNDILSKLIYGARVSLIVGIITGISSTLLGAVLGMMAGYLGGWFDTLIMRAVDVLMTIPSLPLMILIATYVGTQFYMIIFIFTLLGWTGMARTIRAQVLSLKSQKYITAAELAGASRPYVMFRHILPEVSPLLIVSGVLSAAGVMVAEAGLSFLGFGDPKAISWGKMLFEAQANHGLLLKAWWWVLSPGIAISITVIGFMLVGYALEEIVNPRVRQMRVMQRLYSKLVGDKSFCPVPVKAKGGEADA